MLWYSPSILLCESNNKAHGKCCRTSNLDWSSLGVKLGLLLGSSLGNKRVTNLSAELGKQDCLSLGIALSLLLGNSLGYTLIESDC